MVRDQFREGDTGNFIALLRNFSLGSGLLTTITDRIMSIYASCGLFYRSFHVVTSQAFFFLHKVLDFSARVVARPTKTWGSLRETPLFWRDDYRGVSDAMDLEA